jgi:hypothetical protein
MGEMFDPVLREALAAEPDRVDRQLTILRWYFSSYASLLPRQNVLRYEDLVASGGRALAVIDPAAAMLREPLASRNTSDLYDAGLVRELSDRLLADDSISAGLYPPTAIEALREEWRA